MGELSLDEKAEILFFDQAFATAVVLAKLYTITNTSEKNPDDLYRYDLRDPFNLQKGWLLWAGIGFIGALTAVSLSGAALALFNGEPPERETDALVRLLPLIGSSGLSTACLVGITGVLAPVLEENVFRGFLMVALTKWYTLYSDLHLLLHNLPSNLDVCLHGGSNQKRFREKISFTSKIFSSAKWVSIRSTTPSSKPNSRPTTPNPSRPATTNSIGRQRLAESRKSASMRIPSNRDTYKDTDQIPSKSKRLLKALLSRRKSKKDFTLYNYLDEYYILCIGSK